MADIKWVDKHIEVTPPKRCKKITGTRFGAILGSNRWKTPFSAWCEITRTYEEPFVATKYTEAGKTIEPKQADYVERSYGMDIVRPADIYGEDFFNKTWGDFFPTDPVFGGMWDYLAKDDEGNVDTILEMKTSQRVEDWSNGSIPEYYALQAALYAWLYGVDNVIMVASFLSPADYDHPEDYVPSADNTILVPFKVSERYPNFDKLVKGAQSFWTAHVENGKSPDFDERADADILKALRTNSLSPETDIDELIKEAEGLKKELDENAKEFAAKEKRLKAINEIIKKDAMSKFRDGDTKVEIKGASYVWTVSKSETTTVDKDLLTEDGIIDRYLKKTESYKMLVKEVK